MGFHFVDRVYRDVKGTSAKSQAVLAYLAHRADDAGVRKCYPNRASIAAATHVSSGSVTNALNELAEKGFLSWVKGGRKKGGRGWSDANEYTLHLPEKKPTKVVPTGDHGVADAADKGCALQSSPAVACREQGVATIKEDYHQVYIPSEATRTEQTEAVSLAERKACESLAAAWRAKMKETTRSASPVDEAMRICGVNDQMNRKLFANEMMWHKREDMEKVLKKFEEDLRNHKFDKIGNLAAFLTSILQELPRAEK